MCYFKDGHLIKLKEDLVVH